MRIDAHIHFWMPSCGFDNKPIADQESYRRDFMPSTIAPELDAAGIDAVILVQTCPQVAETQWLLALADTDDRIAGVTAWIDLDSESCNCASLIAQPKVVGVRAQLRRIADSAFVRRERVVRNLASVLRAGLALTILAEDRHHAHVIGVLPQLPPGPITLNHLGLPFPDVNRERWRSHLRAYAERPDLYLQFSGLPFLFGERWRGGDAQSVLDDAFDIFGPKRLLFASDWPMLVRFATYGEWVRVVETFMDQRVLSPEDREAIFSRNALRAHPRLRRTDLARARAEPRISTSTFEGQR